MLPQRVLLLFHKGEKERVEIIRRVLTIHLKSTTFLTLDDYQTSWRSDAYDIKKNVDNIDCVLLFLSLVTLPFYHIHLNKYMQEAIRQDKLIGMRFGSGLVPQSVKAGAPVVDLTYGFGEYPLRETLIYMEALAEVRKEKLASSMPISQPTVPVPSGPVIHNRYEILGKIGQGGMGAVYKVHDIVDGTLYALKELLVTDRSAQRAFEREAQLLAQLNHIALPKVTDYFEDQGKFYLVMEFVEGEDYGRKIARGPLPYSEVKRVAAVVSSVLDYLHTPDPATGKPEVIHRDIKPQNIMMTTAGQIKLVDFGLAKADPTKTRQVASVTISGGFTHRYSPLEQIRGATTDVTADGYAYAATVLHLLTGVEPADALHRAAVQLDNDPDPLVSVVELVLKGSIILPTEINVVAMEAAFKKALSMSSRNRYQSIVDTYNALFERTNVQTSTLSSLRQYMHVGKVNFYLRRYVDGLDRLRAEHPALSDPDADKRMRSFIQDLEDNIKRTIAADLQDLITLQELAKERGGIVRELDMLLVRTIRKTFSAIMVTASGKLPYSDRDRNIMLMQQILIASFSMDELQFVCHVSGINSTMFPPGEYDFIKTMVDYASDHSLVEIVVAALKRLNDSSKPRFYW